MFENSLKIVQDAYSGYAQYLWREITHPSWGNYLYWLIGISFFFFALEVLRPVSYTHLTLPTNREV